MKRVGKIAEKAVKKTVFALMSMFAGAKQETSVAALQDISRIIVIRPNYRIGNAILSTAIIAPLRARFPDAQIDFLATDKTAALYANLPVAEVAVMSRSAILRPWRAVSVVRGLRAQRYDLAVQLEQGSLSGLLVASLVGARYVMGKPKGDAVWYDINVKAPITHAYDTGPVFARELGVDVPVSTQLALSREELDQARDQFQALGLAVDGAGQVEPFVAVFVGGHADKVCPLVFWLELIRGLDQSGQRFVVFVGPEENALLPQLRQALKTLPRGVLCSPQPLRVFAAMLAQASRMVTPDSGPMHMAAALGVPVVLVARTRKSLAFVPPADDTHVVWDLNVPQVLAAAVTVPA